MSQMGLNYSKTPHVCFKVESSLGANADDELPRLLERELHSRFDSVRVMKTPLLTSWAFVLETKQKSHSAVLGKSKYAKDEWILLISPPETPTLLDRVRGKHKAPLEVSDLMQVCREIHTTLNGISSATAVRWYFEGFSSQTNAVATPDELPWTDL